MARTAIAPIVAKGPFTGPPSALDLDYLMVAGDDVNGDSFVLSRSALLIMHNTGAGAHLVTIHAVAIDGRDGDIVDYSLGAGLKLVYRVQPFGFLQADGTLWTNVADAEVELALFPL